MTEAQKLLPCPFCGTTEGLYPGYRGMGEGKPYQIDCCGCGIDFTPREGMDVIAAWNRRSTLHGQQSEAVASVSEPANAPALESKPVEWLWWGQDARSKDHVSFGRWQKHPCQYRYKYASPQATEHDHPVTTAPTEAVPVAVSVKPLAWVKVENGWQAITEVGRYRVSASKMRPGWFHVIRDGLDAGFLEGEETAKAAAQADYEARILSAIIPAAKPAGVEEALRKDADWLDSYAYDCFEEGDADAEMTGKRLERIARNSYGRGGGIVSNPSDQAGSYQSVEEYNTIAEQRTPTFSTTKEAEAVAYVDVTGQVSIPVGSKLGDTLRAMPKPAIGKATLPLYLHPAPTATGVSEAMVERAVQTAHGIWHGLTGHRCYTPHFDKVIRAALEAALTTESK